MKKYYQIIAVLSSMFLSTLSYANHHESHDAGKCDDMSKASFSIGHFDSDKDGKITLQEYLAGDASNTEKTYQHLDSNSDGVLDMQEQKEIEAVYKLIHDQYKDKAKNTSI